MKDLTPAERKALRARAHALHPVVMIGSSGLTDAVLKEIDLALKSHELIKVRMLGEDREARAAALARICAALGAGPVQLVGKILVVYRPRPEPEEAPPAAPARKAGRRPRDPRPGIRNRPRRT